MILITGAKGQLGTDVIKELEKRGIDYIGADRSQLDITDKNAVNSFFNEYKPERVIHCAAHTAVDKAEEEPDLSMLINGEGTKNIARACRDIGAEMLYLSTDYVFGGSGDMPYETDGKKNPLSVYGKTKLAGEEAVLSYLDNYYIVRISWVFGKNGSNFVKTMLKLSRTKDSVNVVNDQIGSPTYTVDLSVLLCDMILSGKYGVYHATNEGYCSWAEFAAEIMRLSKSSCKINPITSEEYPAKAERPKNSRLSKASLDKAGFKRLPHWKDALERFLIELNNKEN